MSTNQPTDNAYSRPWGVSRCRMVYTTMFLYRTFPVQTLMTTFAAVIAVILRPYLLTMLHLFALWCHAEVEGYRAVRTDLSFWNQQESNNKPAEVVLLANELGQFDTARHIKCH